MNTTLYSHVIFDFDGTLATLHVDWSKWHDGVRNIARQFDPHFEHPHSFEHAEINELIARFGPDFREKTWKFNRDYEAKMLTGFTVIPHCLAVLKNLKPNQKAYLLTSNDRQTIQPLLKELALEDLFTKTVTRDEVLFAKPHAQPFERIYDKNVPLKEYLMIGDSSADEGFAKNAGIAFIHVSEVE